MPITLNGLPQPIPKPLQPEDDTIAPPDVHPDMAPLPTIGEGLKRYAMPSLAPSPRRDELAALRAKDEQTLDKIQNHSRLGNVIPITPGEGTGHSILRGIEHAGRGLLNVGQFAGNAFGNLFAPGLMAMTPGTDLHNAIQRNKAESQLSDIAKEERDAAKEQSEETLQGAQTREAGARATEAQARAKSLENPPEKDTKINPQEGYAAAIQDAIQANRDPATDPHVQAWKAAIEEIAKQQNPQKPDTPEQQLIDAENAVNTAKTPEEKQKAQASLDQLRRSIKDYSAATQKPERGPTIIQQDAAVDRVAGRLGKPYEAALTQGQQKMDKIDQTLHSIDAGYVGQGLAIPELLTSLVSGQGTGVRITMPELNMITKHRGIQGDFESFMNSIAGKGNLTATDKAQMRAVLGDAKARLAQKLEIHNRALDAINGAEDRAGVVAADKLARQQLSELEKYGHYTGETVHVGGKEVVIQKIHPDGTFD